MNYRKLAGNALVAFSAQGISLLVSFVMSLLVPKILGVVDYGYWQLFVFYATYSGFFHFGLNDGVYLIEGGRNRSEIDKTVINSQFRVAVLLQLAVGFTTCISAISLAPEEERAFVLFSFSLYTAISNLQLYFGYVFQAMNETRLFSISTMLDRLVFLVPLLLLIGLGVSDFRPYVMLYCFSRLCSFLYCLWHARDFLKANTLTKGRSIRLATASIKVGFGLMLANVANMLILGIARVVVDTAWGIEAFGQVSFSFSMVNFFTSFVSQASMVLFPALRQGTGEERRSFYRGMRNAMDLLFPGVYLAYFPMVIFLSIWLPQYASSMSYFALLLPVCVFNTKMDICCTTYFKVLRQERLLLAVNFVTVIGSAITSLAGIYLFKSIDAVLVGAVTCIVLRSLWSEHYLNKALNVQTTKASLHGVLLTLCFIALSLNAPMILAVLGYLAAYIIFLSFNWRITLTLLRHVKAIFERDHSR